MAGLAGGCREAPPRFHRRSGLAPAHAVRLWALLMVYCAVLSCDLRDVVLVKGRDGKLELPQGPTEGRAGAARAYADACGVFVAGSAWKLAAYDGGHVGVSEDEDYYAIYTLRAPPRWFDGTSLSNCVRHNEALDAGAYPTFVPVADLLSLETHGEVAKDTHWMVMVAANALATGDVLAVDVKRRAA